jgi:hypothetical protein
MRSWQKSKVGKYNITKESPLWCPIKISLRESSVMWRTPIIPCMLLGWQRICSRFYESFFFCEKKWCFFPVLWVMISKPWSSSELDNEKVSHCSVDIINFSWPSSSNFPEEFCSKCYDDNNLRHWKMQPCLRSLQQLLNLYNFRFCHPR